MAIPNFFRTDGWVKSPQGQALAGAQVYVCTQPANVSARPPSPLATIYSDSQGAFPITQPIYADGFGHYDFYAAAGLYTIVIGWSGLVNYVLPDQSVGGVGTSGTATSVLFETNGAPDIDQMVRNSVQGTGIVITTDAFGNTTFTNANPTGTLMETNGVANVAQSPLNLVNGAGIVVTNDGLGNTTITNTGLSVVVGTNVAANLPFSVFYSNDTGINTSGFAYVEVVLGNAIKSTPARWTVSIYIETALSAVTKGMYLLRTAKNSLTTVDITPITFGGTVTPLFNNTGVNTSDAINLQIDTQHDHYFIFNGNANGGTGVIFCGGTSTTDPSFFAGSTNGVQHNQIVWDSFVGAGGGWGAAFPLGGSADFYFLLGWNAA